MAKSSTPSRKRSGRKGKLPCFSDALKSIHRSEFLAEDPQMQAYLTNPACEEAAQDLSHWLKAASGTPILPPTTDVPYLV